MGVHFRTVDADPRLVRQTPACNSWISQHKCIHKNLLLPFWLKKNEKMKCLNYFKKEEWRLILVVGFSYFINLFLLRGQNALVHYFKNTFEYGYLASSAMGLLVGTFFYGFYADKYSRANLLLLSGVSHLLICLITYSIVNEATLNWVIYTWRFFTGILLAGSFGLGITLIVEALPRSKRLWGSAWVTALGMLGVCFNVGLAELDKENVVKITMGIGVIISLLLLVLQWKYRSHLFEGEQNRIQGNQSLKIENFLPRFFSNQTQWKNLLLLALVGLPLQFCINFLIPYLVKIKPGASLNYAYGWFYLLFFISVLLTAIIYDKVQRASIVIQYGLLVQLVAIIIIFATDWPYELKSILLGFGGGGIWWLITQIAVENNGEAHRASAAIFVSNFSRASIVLLAFGTQLNPTENTSARLVTIVVIGSALIASLFLPKNFSPRLKKSATNDLLPQDAIEIIRDKQKELYEDKNIENYLNECTNVLKERIFESFNTLRFAFYCLEDKKEDVIHITRGSAIKDNQLFENPVKTALEVEADWKAIRTLTMRLISHGKCFSFTNQILNKKKIAVQEEHVTGFLLYQASKPLGILPTLFNAKKDALPKGYKALDLNNISIKAGHLERFREIEHSDQVYKIVESLDEMAKTAFDHPGAKKDIEQLNLGLKMGDEMDSLKRALLLYKLDALHYKRGYFAYFVAPFYVEQRGIAFLTTSYPASVEQLRRITDVVAFVMNGVVELKTKDSTREEVMKQNNHGMNTILSSIKTNLSKLEYAKNYQDFIQYMRSIQLHFDFIYQINLLSTVLDKISYKRENISKFSDAQNINERLAIFEFSLAETINGLLKTIQDALETVAPNKSKEEREIYYQYLEENVMQSVQKDLGNIKIMGVNIALQIILQDILTNAIRYNSSKPEIRIVVAPTEKSELPDEFLKRNSDNFPVINYLTLAISNKFKLSDENFDILLGKETGNSKSSTSRSFGIATIMRILKYDGLGRSGQPWYFVPKKKEINLTEDNTTLLLLIPINDTNYGRS